MENELDLGSVGYMMGLLVRDPILFDILPIFFDVHSSGLTENWAPINLEFDAPRVGLENCPQWVTLQIMGSTLFFWSCRKLNQMQTQEKELTSPTPTFPSLTHCSGNSPWDIKITFQCIRSLDHVHFNIHFIINSFTSSPDTKHFWFWSNSHKRWTGINIYNYKRDSMKWIFFKLITQVQNYKGP